MIVAHQKSLAAPHLAEALDIPHVRALAVPMLTPTRAFAVPGLVRRILGGLLNRASYRLVGLLSRPYSGLIRSWRGDSVDLAPRGKPPAAAKTLYCYSPSLVPTPADWPPDAVLPLVLGPLMSRVRRISSSSIETGTTFLRCGRKRS